MMSSKDAIGVAHAIVNIEDPIMVHVLYTNDNRTENRDFSFFQFRQITEDIEEPVTSVDAPLLSVEEVEEETAQGRELWGFFVDRQFWKCRIISIKKTSGRHFLSYRAKSVIAIRSCL